jgi:hypothetical protein
MSATETLWQEISVAALLGTQRRPFQPGVADDEFGRLLTISASPQPAGAANSPDPIAAERLLLRAAALTSLHRRAGRLPALVNPSFPPPAEEEEWPRCSPQAGRCLEQILSDGLLALLPEWVEAAAASQQRVREEHLPILLNQQKAIQPLRRALLPVLGARGRWLAAQNPDWSAVGPNPGEPSWSEGQRKERLAYLEDLRAEDPARARDLLASTWPQESPAERVAFLPILAAGLSQADEPFLESILDDRRKDVRQAAAALLARLPESRLVQRHTLRARALLNWKSGLLQRSTLEVSLPDSCDASMLRDGIDPRLPAGSKFGEKAWCLAQILSFVPPRTWSAAWNKRPIQILDAIRKHEWEAALLEGWKEAALRAADADWLEALVNHDFKSGEQKRLIDFFPRLPVPVKERLVISLLREYPSLSYDQPVSLFLSACRHPWSPNLTQSVTACLCQTLQKGDLQPWRWEKLLRDIPPFFNANLLAPTIDRLAAALRKKETGNPFAATGDPFAAALLSTLEFRLTLHQAFVPDSFPGNESR